MIIVIYLLVAILEAFFLFIVWKLYKHLRDYDTIRYYGEEKNMTWQSVNGPPKVLIRTFSSALNSMDNKHGSPAMGDVYPYGQDSDINMFRGWTKYDRSRSCFLVLAPRLRWAEADRACAKYGAKLASITDEYENAFVFDLAKKANLTTPTVWLGRLVKLTRTGAYEWHDGAIGRQAEGFRGEPPSGTELCLTLWLDFDRPEGSWNEWDCNYAMGYSAMCKKSFKKPAFTFPSTLTPSSAIHSSRRCCVQSGCGLHCSSTERCIPDDLFNQHIYMYIYIYICANCFFVIKLLLLIDCFNFQQKMCNISDFS
uniref:C-type lectin domain-containing protein n=1 Tax=Heterorhabditis bacteriophora TaxID=37862 RepID=A0A1I7WZN1_HETBA